MEVYIIITIISSHTNKNIIFPLAFFTCNNTDENIAEFEAHFFELDSYIAKLSGVRDCKYRAIWLVWSLGLATIELQATEWKMVSGQTQLYMVLCTQLQC